MSRRWKKARALNAFVTETGERAAEMAKASDARIAKGEAKPLEGLPLAIKDLFCTKGVRTTAGRHILGNFVPPYEFTVTTISGARRGDARQDQYGRIRHGLVERDQRFEPGVQSLAAQRREHAARAGRFVGRLGRRGGGASVPRRHRHRHRRLDPPAGRGHRHGRHQADLWPLLALGHRGLRLVARSGRTDDAHGARCRDPAALDGEPDDKDSTSVDLPVPDYEAAVGKR